MYKCTDQPDLDIVITIDNFLQIMFYEDDTLIVAGSVTILDLDNVTTGHFTQMTPTQMRKMMAMGQASIIQ